MRSTGWDMLASYSNPVPGDIQRALMTLGIVPIRTVTRQDGAEEVLARCPMHLANTGKEDRNPSFWVNSDHGAYVCFSCHYSGPFVQLVCDALEVDRANAVRWVAAQGIYRVRSIDDTPAGKSGPDEAPITEAALALYVPPPAKALKRRNLDAEACARYGVLWDPGNDRWILPIRDPGTGELMGWQEKGKRFFRNRPDGIAKSSTLFGLDAFTGGLAILVESPLDCVRLASVGIAGGVASFGAFVSDSQMRLLRLRADRVVLALDNDAAGIAGRDKVYSRWRPRGIPMEFLDYSHTDAKDVGDMEDAHILLAMLNRYPAYSRKRGR